METSKWTRRQIEREASKGTFDYNDDWVCPKCGNTKDVDYHNQKLIVLFSTGETDKVGELTEDITFMKTFRCQNYYDAIDSGIKLVGLTELLNLDLREKYIDEDDDFVLWDEGCILSDIESKTRLLWEFVLNYCPKCKAEWSIVVAGGIWVDILPLNFQWKGGDKIEKE